MVELWGKRNVARLSRESGVARESVSKILSYKRGVGLEVASKLAAPLELDPSQLVTPQVEPMNLASVVRRLEALAAQADAGRQMVIENLASIDARLSQIERSLGLPAPAASGAPGA